MDMDASTLQMLSICQMTAVFAGAFFFGETVILAAFFLTARGVWHPAGVFWLSFAGTLAADSVWFLFGRRIVPLFNRWEKYAAQSKRLLAVLERRTGRRPFVSLLFIKFLYGTRILTIIYLSIRQIGFRTFILFDTIGTLIWLTVMMAIGWLAGRSIINFAPALKRAELSALLLILVLIIFRSGTLWISKKITKQ